jgi:crotonobetainyl-CoA:carnitine CoA-transferase CaiB-like acyl-CoA transferase
MKPLEGIRILDLSRMVAGGIAGMLLADFGAEVVKVEQPVTGDPLRQWTSGGKSLWWKVYARNKRFVTLNLKAPEGRDLLLRMLPQFDVLMESFVPGTLERLGLDWDTLRTHHPRLILLRISGWGQTGPDSGRPGFGTLVEAASGFAEMNGEPDGGPIVPGFPLADSVSGLYASNAIMYALYHRDVHGASGQVIDVSLFESLFSLLGPLPAEYAALGSLRRRDGSRSRNAGPRGCYRTSDGSWIAVSGSTPKMAERLLRSYGLEHLLEDPRFASNGARVTNTRELDEEVARAIASRTLEENVAIIEANALTAIPVQTIADIESDPHWQARGLTVDVPNGSGGVRMHSVVPRLSETPGGIRWAGGDLGQDNQAHYEALGLSFDEQQRLRASGVI